MEHMFWILFQSYMRESVEAKMHGTHVSKPLSKLHAWICGQAQTWHVCAWTCVHTNLKLRLSSKMHLCSRTSSMLSATMQRSSSSPAASWQSMVEHFEVATLGSIWYYKCMHACMLKSFLHAVMITSLSMKCLNPHVNQHWPHEMTLHQFDQHRLNPASHPPQVCMLVIVW